MKGMVLKRGKQEPAKPGEIGEGVTASHCQMLQPYSTASEWQRMAQMTALPVQLLAVETSTASTRATCGTSEDRSFETGLWPTLFTPERMLSTHRDPGCVTFPAPPHTTSCSRPRAYSFRWDTVGFGLTGCASPECTQRPRSGQAFPANRGSPAFRQHLKTEKESPLPTHSVDISWLGTWPGTWPWHCCHCSRQSCTTRTPSFDGCCTNN